MRNVLAAAVVCVLVAAPARADDYDSAIAQRDVMLHAPTAREREVAQFALAVTLHELALRQASYALFAEIAQHPTHARWRETLPWLVTLAAELGEPADVIELVGRYPETIVEAVTDDETRWALDYALGRYAYRNHRYSDALRLFAKIDKRSALYTRAQIQSGMAHVLMRRTDGALRSFNRVLSPR